MFWQENTQTIYLLFLKRQQSKCDNEKALGEHTPPPKHSPHIFNPFSDPKLHENTQKWQTVVEFTSQNSARYQLGAALHDKTVKPK